jgi:tetratricopeptide (TPR) repeat protein
VRRLELLPLIGALALALAAAPALAQSSKEKEEAEKKKAAATQIDPQTGKKIQAANDALTAQPPNYSAAKASLDSIKKDGLSPYESSRVYQLYAFLYNAQEKYGEARAAFKQAIDSGGLNEVELDQIRFNIAQLFLAEEKWREGAQALEQWIAATPKPNSNAFYMLAVAYYQMGDERKALPPAEKAIAMSEKPQPSWLQLVLALYLKNEQYAKAEPMVRKLVAAEPMKKENWVQLSAVLGAQEKYDDALVALQLAYHLGLLKDDGDVRRLADLMAFNNIPYRCGSMLTKAVQEKKVNNDGALQEKIANCWVAAREWDKAVAPLRSAAQMKRSGDLYVRLGEVHVQREDWKSAIEALKAAIATGNAKDPGNAHVLTGMAYYNLKQPKEARAAFQRAMGTRHAKQAEGWIRAIDTEAGG